MNAVKPVVPGLEAYETGGENQSDGSDGLVILRSPHGITVSRWTFTDEERRAIAEGADIYLSVFTMNQPFQPVKLNVGLPVESGSVADFRREMRLDDELEMRKLLKEANESQNALKERQVQLFSGDQEVQNLARKAAGARQALELKKAEVFSDKPSPILSIN